MKVITKEINSLYNELKAKKPYALSLYIEKWLDLYNQFIKDGNLSLKEYSQNYRKMMEIRDILWEYSVKQR